MIRPKRTNRNDRIALQGCHMIATKMRACPSMRCKPSFSSMKLWTKQIIIKRVQKFTRGFHGTYWKLSIHMSRVEEMQSVIFVCHFSLRLTWVMDLKTAWTNWKPIPDLRYPRSASNTICFIGVNWCFYVLNNVVFYGCKCRQCIFWNLCIYPNR